MVEIPERFRTPLVYTLPGMEQVPVVKDLVYSQADGLALHMDVYRPVDLRPGERRPAVLFVHGDAPPEVLTHAKEWGAYTSWGRLAACNGLVGITFNHRSTQARTRMAEACSDVLAAIEYVRTNAAALGVDPDSLCFWVCSAGGLKLKLVLQENPTFIRCTVAYYPLMDLTAWREHTPTTFSDEVLQEFSAINYVSPLAAPILLVRAGLDHPALNSGIDRFVQAALAQNMRLDLYNHPAGEHAFDTRNANARSREIIALTLAFMNRHLSAGDEAT